MTLQTTDAQVRKLMEEFAKHGRIGVAALRSGMHRDTASKYLAARKLPSELKQPRNWRTRPDPFVEDWHLVEALLLDAPELEAKALFDWLVEHKRPGKYQEGQLRTFQRRVKRWRATDGPPKEVFFAQEHRPGEAMQTDFTSGNELGVTIGGEAFPHLLCHVVLPYSNWQWTTVCRSESMAALRRGCQAAVFKLGKRPQWHQTDNSTAATHAIGGGGGKRDFNTEYVELMEHLGMKPRTIGVGKSNQNGDVEALNGALKRRLTQHLLLRESRDFDSVADYETWVQGVCSKANVLRHDRLVEDLVAMEAVTAQRLPEWKDERTRVTGGSTIRIKHNTYSVPSQLIREWVRVRIYDDRLEVWYAEEVQVTIERLLGRHGHRVNYRHVIESLVRKPWAFERYRYREELFPTVVFRRAYDALAAAHAVTRRGDLAYLRVLYLAARTMECDVAMALELLLDEGQLPTYERVRDLVEPAPTQVPEMAVLEPDLKDFDRRLLSAVTLQEVA
ncbi:MAG: IS21 family transposase [Proteobacteria bacterium]|nr:IS21 family transposase [Pseudomonadota bacterium]